MTNWHPDDVIDMDNPGEPGAHITSRHQALRILDTMLNEIPIDSNVRPLVEAARTKVAETDDPSQLYAVVDGLQMAYMMMGA